MRGLSGACSRQRTISTGRCAWIKLCIGGLPHCPFSVSLPVHLNPPTPPLPPARGSFWKIMAIIITCIMSMFFCEVRIGLCALYPYTHCVQLFTDRLCKRLRGAETEEGSKVQVVNGSTTGSLVHKTTQNLNRVKGCF